MAFASWDPIRDLLAIQQRLDRFKPGPAGWVPPVDLYETADAYVVTAELPGVARENLDINFASDRLTISGTRHKSDLSFEQFHRIERGHGMFSRAFHLPVPVDPTRIAADLREGVLTVTCPKSGDSAARRIRIS